MHACLWVYSPSLLAQLCACMRARASSCPRACIHPCVLGTAWELAYRASVPVVVLLLPRRCLFGEIWWGSMKRGLSLACFACCVYVCRRIHWLRMRVLLPMHGLAYVLACVCLFVCVCTACPHRILGLILDALCTPAGEVPGVCCSSGEKTVPSQGWASALTERGSCRMSERASERQNR